MAHHGSIHPFRQLCENAFYALFIGSLLLLAGTGCQTVPKAVHKNPFLLMGAHDAYVHFPVKGNEALAESLLNAYFPDISADTRNTALARVSAVYAGFDLDSAARVVPETFGELVVAGSFPRTALGSALRAKNGWTKIRYGAGICYRHNAAGIELYAGIPGVLCIAHDVSPMLARAGNPAEERAFAAHGVPPQMTSTAFGSDVQFYLPRVARFLPQDTQTLLALLPGNIIAAVSASGTLAKEAQTESYILSLDVNARHERAAAVLLPFVSRMLDGNATATQDGHILLCDIRLSVSFLGSLAGENPR
jgi:hypothetical protein